MLCLPSLIQLLVSSVLQDWISTNCPGVIPSSSAHFCHCITGQLNILLFFLQCFSCFVFSLGVYIFGACAISQGSISRQVCSHLADLYLTCCRPEKRFVVCFNAWREREQRIHYSSASHCLTTAGVVNEKKISEYVVYVFLPFKTFGIKFLQKFSLSSCNHTEYVLYFIHRSRCMENGFVFASVQ